ncbi:hypothetical protein DPEC_G00233390 [Dallia pectoralis]|uniref:Uncharacterized protein n=1 Tax=Dallia pectoralis TaxID=75939 RepID=A0ACC2FXB2_DALPE|nr:hypothetical protein DPEC_G00233390 [Dallia pectoralis]
MAPFETRGKFGHGEEKARGVPFFSSPEQLTAHSRHAGGKEGREGRHLLPWLRAGYGDPAIEDAPFSCSLGGNVTHFKIRAEWLWRGSYPQQQNGK